MTTPVTEELPPRARRILNNRRQQFGNQGTTSACAENTWRCCWCERVWWNYLRVRGEYVSKGLTSDEDLELPPRARRIRESLGVGVTDDGTTSACAENTVWCATNQGACGNYLRVRGEYRFWGWGVSGYQELPPRARRIPHRHPPHDPRRRTTSACAENTDQCGAQGYGNWNYLRVRGEYYWRAWENKISAELPPRARRIRYPNHRGFFSAGTTSACAENTTLLPLIIIVGVNYLRVRGEYKSPQMLPPVNWELPPRARRIRSARIRAPRTSGTTSACAENTLECR